MLILLGLPLRAMVLDTVENGVNNFIKNVDLIESIKPQVKNDIKNVSQLDQSTSAKIETMFNYLDGLHLLTPIVNEIAKIASGRFT
jgi:hypothetical protein